MDLITSLIGLGLVVLTILPFVYFHTVNKKNKERFLKEFKALAQQAQVNVTEYDVWSDYFGIGLDANTNKLFYYKKRGGIEDQALINLSEVEACRVINTKKILNDDEVIACLELAFTFSTPRMPEKLLQFYSKEEFMTHNGELQLVEKWKTIVGSRLIAKRKLPLAS